MKVKNLAGFPDEQKHYALLKEDGTEGRTAADWMRKGFNIAREQIGELEMPEAKKHKVSYEDLKKALMDIAEFENAYDLVGMTGLSLERCERIREIFDLLIEEDKKK